MHSTMVTHARSHTQRTHIGGAQLRLCEPTHMPCVGSLHSTHQQWPCTCAHHVPLTENTGNGSSNGEKKWHTVLQQASKLLWSRLTDTESANHAARLPACHGFPAQPWGRAGGVNAASMSSGGSVPGHVARARAVCVATAASSACRGAVAHTLPHCVPRMRPDL